jgi:hypothetical protein
MEQSSSSETTGTYTSNKPGEQKANYKGGNVREEPFSHPCAWNALLGYDTESLLGWL